MNESLQPVTTDTAPTISPRTLTREQMREHLDQGLAQKLSDRDRHLMFVRYDTTWWIGDQTGFIEITDAGQNARLDRWHQRLTNGALWD
jgi:hypothetical protein